MEERRAQHADLPQAVETCEQTRHYYYPCRRVLLFFFFLSCYCPPAWLTVCTAHPCLRHVFTAWTASCHLLAFFFFVFLRLLSMWKKAGVVIKLWCRKDGGKIISSKRSFSFLFFLLKCPKMGQAFFLERTRSATTAVVQCTSLDTSSQSKASYSNTLVIVIPVLIRIQTLTLYRVLGEYNNNG